MLRKNYYGFGKILSFQAEFSWLEMLSKNKYNFKNKTQKDIKKDTPIN